MQAIASRNAANTSNNNTYSNISSDSHRSSDMSAQRRKQQYQSGPLQTQRPGPTPAELYRASLLNEPKMRPLSTATEMFDVDSDVDIEDDDDEEIVDEEQYFGMEQRVGESDLTGRNDDGQSKWDWERGRLVDVDEDDSEFEEDLFAGVGKRSFESEDSRRRSQTTLSSYDEVPTPDRGLNSRPFIMISKPVEGPRGPHLFRSSQSSSDFAFDHALQMSPLIPIKLDLGPETARRDSHNTTNSISKQLDLSDDINDEDAHSIIRRWSPREVTEWMTSWEIDPSVVRCFEKHDINGAVLLDLQYEHLRELDIESFGKRHQLWSAICILRGDDEPSHPQEASRPSTRNAVSRTSSHNSQDIAPSSSSESEEVEPAPKAPTAEANARRARKKKPTIHDTIHPGESISIVAIEQLLPKPHNCSKGEACGKRQRQQAQIRMLQEANAIGRFPVNKTETKVAEEAAAIPRSPSAPPSSLRVPGRQTMSALPSPRTFIQQSEPGTPMRPTSEVVPSVVASSDLLGPGQLPAFNIQTNLQADLLDRVETRDPQDNVRNFLTFQHMNSPATALPLTPLSPLAGQTTGYQVPRSHSVATVHQMFPTQHHQAYPSLAASSTFSRSKTPGSGERLKDLPRLNIPSSSGGVAEPNQYVNNNNIGLASPRDRTSISRNMTASPPTQIYRLGTPASEMDVPVTAIAAGPIARDVSQSVPPNMQFRQPTQQSPRSVAQRANHASTDWRRPSLLHTVKEGEVFPGAAAAGKQNQPRPSMSTMHSSKESTSTINSTSTRTTTASPEKKASDPAHNSPVTRQFGYGASCTHAGWMKKRRTKMLRHEWQEAHFRLTGSQLNMHDSARLTAALKESINVDDYAVACSTLPSNSKLSAAMRSALNHLNSSSSSSGSGAGQDGSGAAAAKEIDPTAFAFQLVPERPTTGAAAVARKLHAPTLAKTHHFAVTSKDERIDWMREIMLTKALQQRGKGYEVQVNGVQQD